MKLYFIRHGFAYHNLAFEQVGEKAINDPKYMDAQLTPVGEKQAREAAVAANKEAVDAAKRAKDEEAARNAGEAALKMIKDAYVVSIIDLKV